MNERKFSFDKDNEPLEDQEMSGGIKISSSRSRFAQKAKAKEQFEQHVHDVRSQHEGHLKEGYELSRRFMQVLVDTTLPDNKGPMAKSVEKEAIGNLIDWTVKVNNDQREHKGMGSSAVLTILLNSLLKMRDSHNVIQHKYSLLEEKIFKLSSQAKKPHEEE